MRANQAKSNVIDYCFPNTKYMAETPIQGKTAADVGQKYAKVAGFAVAESLLLTPKMIFGTALAPSCRSALHPASLTIAERGVAGSMSFVVGKTIQFAGAAVGAAVGALASLAGALIGRGGQHWIDLAAGKGWQIGTIIASGVMMPSELARNATFPIFSVLALGANFLGNIGHVLGQTVDAATTAPLYSQTT